MVCVQGPGNSSTNWPSSLRSSYSGKLEIREPGEESGLEDLRAAVEGVAGEPDHLLLGEAQRARMVELVAQLRLVDLVGEAHRPCVRLISEKVRLHVRVEAPDHLQHQQLVEIGVEQAADDRVELPGVVVDPLGDIDLLHHQSTPSTSQPRRA